MKSAKFFAFCVILMLLFCSCVDFAHDHRKTSDEFTNETAIEGTEESDSCVLTEDTQDVTDLIEQSDTDKQSDTETEAHTEEAKEHGTEADTYTVDAFGENTDVSLELGIYGKTTEEAGDLYFLAPNVVYEYGYYSLPEGKIFCAEFISRPEPEGGDVLVVWLSLGAKTEKVKVSKGNKVVYLTFDDGPNEKNTERILDILKEYDIKATFFTLGSNIDKNPKITKRIYEEGHTVGCHSYSHVYDSIYANQDSFTEGKIQWKMQ